MADIFISYSSEDKTIVKDIAARLEAKGWTVWWDRQIPIGQKYDTVIETELQNARCVVVIWTHRSVLSEWVKNEALEAAGKNILVPVMLEQVTLPLAFKRIESAMLIGWNGEDDHPELDNFYQSIGSILNPDKKTTVTGNGNAGNKPVSPDRKFLNRYVAAAVAGLVAALGLLYYYLTYIKGNIATDIDQKTFYAVLVLFGIAACAFVFGSVSSYVIFKTGKRNTKLALTAGSVAGLALIWMGSLLLPSKPAERTIAIRIFDWKKNPITAGDVKIYLQEYIRTQSIDKMGQALFTGIPAETAKRKMRIEVSSPGYATKNYDTLVTGFKPLELVLPLTTVVMISGKVKTAAEMPIRGVEINVDGTRYYAVSITDGTYNLRLEEYTLGDEINITTSHKDYEDKTISLKINAPDIKNEDIFLNPVHH